MKTQTLIVLAAFGFLIVVHSLFPPRRYEGSFENSFRRGFIFSENFHTRYFSESGLELYGQDRRSSSSQVSYEVNWSLYGLELAALFGGTLLFAALAQLVKFDTNKSVEQDVTPNA